MNAERRPTESGTASRCLLGGDITSVSPEAFAAHKRRREALVRRIDSRNLTALLESLYPKPVVPPSTYGMDQAELRAYGSHLLAEGWTREDVLKRLAIAPGRAA